MGWNDLRATSNGASHPVLAGMDGENVYFVHSFAFETTRPEHQLMVTDYAADVTAVVGRDNMISTQFHPEKSQSVGLRLLSQFLRWTP